MPSSKQISNFFHNDQCLLDSTCTSYFSSYMKPVKCDPRRAPWWVTPARESASQSPIIHDFRFTFKIFIWGNLVLINAAARKSSLIALTVSVWGSFRTKGTYGLTKSGDGFSSCSLGPSFSQTMLKTVQLLKNWEHYFAIITLWAQYCLLIHCVLNRKSDPLDGEVVSPPIAQLWYKVFIILAGQSRISMTPY